MLDRKSAKITELEYQILQKDSKIEALRSTLQSVIRDKSRLSDSETKWIPILEGCEMPNHNQDVIITIWCDNSYGKGTVIYYDIDIATYTQHGGYLDAANGQGGFDTSNDWDEGQPIKVTAWMPLPKPYISDSNKGE